MSIETKKVETPIGENDTSKEEPQQKEKSAQKVIDPKVSRERYDKTEAQTPLAGYINSPNNSARNSCIDRTKPNSTIN